ncbi:MAG: excinuclease ABC subunit UvrA [Chloroflexota bacterium]|nr:excinuclease ABC subunit UvrA [Chloroflexota bacterium]MDQ6906536.1 excinuclease ABC subunit UvrA [Chloroflexota bacterium]
MPHDEIIVRGAREHNLKNVDLTIPRDKLVVFTGLSGSGKSSLAFDTIYAEGQRRYVESLSAYARQFLGLMEKPDVDHIDGLSPAISIDQKSTSRNPRSTVGTVTEIYDYLRLLYARIGHAHSPTTGRPIQKQSAEQIVERILDMADGTRLLILAPVIRDRKGEHQGIFEEAKRTGFVRVRVNGTVHDLDEKITLAKYKKHTIEIVVDRLVIRHDADSDEAQGFRTRLTDSVETALRHGEGVMIAGEVDGPDRFFSEKLADPETGESFEELEPRAFSFNSPHGACPHCSGLGTVMEFDPDLIIPNRDLTLAEGAVQPWVRTTQGGQGYYLQLLTALGEQSGFRVNTPTRNFSPEQLGVILYGNNGEYFPVQYQTGSGKTRTYDTTFEGVIPNLKRRYKETSSDHVRQEIERYMGAKPCPVCMGKRLKPESLAVTIAGYNLTDVTEMTVRDAQRFFDALAHRSRLDGLQHETYVVGIVGKEAVRIQLSAADLELSEREQIIARQIFKEIRERLGFLVDVGLDYLTLNRAAATLSGGEAQRIRLATQIGSSLMGVIYILDEPSIGLHQRDNARLINTLLRLRDQGNTLIVVEHDEDTMRTADWIVDIGPGAGELGGHIVAEGTADEISANPASVTGQFLSGRRSIPIPPKRRRGSGKSLHLKGARGNNLKNLDVRFPLGTFTVVTGVSGSGKSTLITDTLYRRLAQHIYHSKERPDPFDALVGMDHLDKVIDIDQSPIGRTPRSNPATYTGLFAPIRELFASLPEAKLRGYKPGRFSFNVKGGRCETCSGDGIIQIEMQFLPDVYVPCEVCHGARYNRETLEVKYRGKSIADVLDMTVDEALEMLGNIPQVANKLQTIADVGLGYIHLGQSSTTLSGGEAQRVKLATELSRRATGKTMYILDEPTTGLHFADVERLLQVLQRLVDTGNTVLVIEHNLDVIKSADWVIDLGPEGGDKGGEIIAEGTPEQIADVTQSHTGHFLRRLLNVRRGEPAGVAAM